MIRVGYPAGSKTVGPKIKIEVPNPHNNPAPTTARGQRRHEKRNHAQQLHAQKCWG